MNKFYKNLNPKKNQKNLFLYKIDILLFKVKIFKHNFYK